MLSIKYSYLKADPRKERWHVWKGQLGNETLRASGLPLEIGVKMCSTVSALCSRALLIFCFQR